MMHTSCSKLGPRFLFDVVCLAHCYLVHGLVCDFNSNGMHPLQALIP